MWSETNDDILLLASVTGFSTSPSSALSLVRWSLSEL